MCAFKPRGIGDYFMPGSAMCLGLKQIMKANNKSIKIKLVATLPIKPRQMSAGASAAKAH